MIVGLWFGYIPNSIFVRDSIGVGLSGKTGLEDVNMEEQNRYLRGRALLERIDGNGGEAVIEMLRDIAPDFARLLVEFPFADIYSRPGLDLKSREMATIAALAALGNAAPQLKIHIRACLNVGCTQEEITEILIQMAVYAGFPAALNALFVAKEVFRETDGQFRPE